METNRRQFMVMVAGSIAAVPFMTIPSFAAAEPSAADRIKEFTGGAEMLQNKLTLTAPEIAENGNTVPITVEVDSAMEDDDMVESIMIVADGNPNAEVITYNFTAMSGEASAKTRIRLATTQKVTAVAKMKDGTFEMAESTVKVTIGGCGG